MSRQLSLTLPGPAQEPLAAGATVLRGYALSNEQPLLIDIAETIRQAPFRHMLTPGGFRMSVAMTNCGPLGWVSDRRGYRYDTHDPASGQPWPALPESMLQLATTAASAAASFLNCMPVSAIMRLLLFFARSPSLSGCIRPGYCGKPQ